MLISLSYSHMKTFDFCSLCGFALARCGLPFFKPRSLRSIHAVYQPAAEKTRLRGSCSSYMPLGWYYEKMQGFPNKEDLENHQQTAIRSVRLVPQPPPSIPPKHSGASIMAESVLQMWLCILYSHVPKAPLSIPLFHRPS